MSHRIEMLEARIDALERELAAIREGVAGVQPVESSSLPNAGSSPSSARQQGIAEDTSEELLTWVGKSSLLPRVSTLCFLLVVALILRTVTDNDLLDKQVGSLIGMAYAALLISVGWHKYSRLSPLAPVFAVCGGALMYTIVIETHAHFESLPSVPAYVILVVTGVAMASISYLFNNALPVLVGTLGLAIASVAIDYPNPHFPYLALVLLIANLLASFATRLQRSSWLRWILLFVTSTMLAVWGIKLGLKLGRGGRVEELSALGLYWYLPVIAVFFLSYLGTAVLAVTQRQGEGVARFDLALPTFNGLWAFTAAYLVVRVWFASPIPLAVIGLFSAGVHFGFAFWLKRRHGERATGLIAHIFAGFSILTLVVPFLTGSLLTALPILSLGALGLLFLSQAWQRGGIRALSYFFQVGACGVMVFLLLDEGPGKAFLAASIAAGVTGLAAMIHFQSSRRQRPPTDSRLFSKWDPEDRTAVLVALSAFVSGFFLLREGLYQIILRAGNGGEGVFQGGQTVIVNFAAAGLLLFAFGRRNKEYRNIAILIMLIGAGRVFIMDLFRISGMPLVLSVFSFGLAVSLISVALTRWQKLEMRDVGGAAGREDSISTGCLL